MRRSSWQSKQPDMADLQSNCRCRKSITTPLVLQAPSHIHGRPEADRIAAHLDSTDKIAVKPDEDLKAFDTADQDETETSHNHCEVLPWCHIQFDFMPTKSPLLSNDCTEGGLLPCRTAERLIRSCSNGTRHSSAAGASDILASSGEDAICGRN